MKRLTKLSGILLLFLFSACKDDDHNKEIGTVVFGANYHIINCITNIDVFIDDKHVGQLEVPTDSVPDCNANYGLKAELEAGYHTYKVEIRPLMGNGCTEDVEGELNITEAGCETVFINYLEIFSNQY